MTIAEWVLIGIDMVRHCSSKAARLVAANCRTGGAIPYKPFCGTILSGFKPARLNESEWRRLYEKD